ncbi:hypothetical protein B0T17DRAFT_635096, partial [Bombardia bombarda]
MEENMRQLHIIVHSNKACVENGQKDDCWQKEMAASESCNSHSLLPCWVVEDVHRNPMDRSMLESGPRYRVPLSLQWGISWGLGVPPAPASDQRPASGQRPSAIHQVARRHRHSIPTLHNSQVPLPRRFDVTNMEPRRS